ncbi:MAG: hypothetical protein CMI24_06600 [Opitutae bacterium]|nr:hypothetical protein [Opitutae bacterium]MEC8419925.1 tetratricopeptide repeat protein [Verrucomicrobiota bacterium]
MISKTYIYSFFIFLSLIFAEAQTTRKTRGAASDEKQYLFPGTGFFVKNRLPYDEEEAKALFREAFALQNQGKENKALTVYEMFSKRRTDATLKVQDTVFKVGPESLYRAAAIREQKGDLSKSYDHLRLIAKAYNDYDFEIVAESLMRVAEKLASGIIPKKWGFIPRFRSGSQDRYRLSQIADLARGPKFAPRALMALAEISIKDDKEEEAIDALERLINLYPENHLSEKAYFLMATIYRKLSSGASYDQSKSTKALNYFEDYLILFSNIPPRGTHETESQFNDRREEFNLRKKLAEKGRVEMREILATSKLQLGSYIEDYGKYYLTNWKKLGDGPALQFYNEAITIAPESEAARKAEIKISNLYDDSE